MKKILSIFLGTALIILTFSGILTAQAETTTYAVGDRPYATANSKTDVIIKSGEDIKFYDDYIVKDNIDSYADATAMVSASTWKVQTKTTPVTDYSSAELNTDAEYSYGGNSFKFNYKSAAPSTATAQGDTVVRNYHRLTSQKDITINAEFWETASIAFWVKTEKEVNIAFRIFDFSSGTVSQWLISEEFKLYEGEYIVEIPLATLAVTNVAYIKGNNNANSSSYVKFYYPEFLVRPAAFDKENGETERSLYIDNLGYYNISPNSDSAVHNAKAMTKVAINDYVQSETDETKIECKTTSGTYLWQHSDAAISTTKTTISPCDEVDGVNENAYKGIGQSIKYNAQMTYNYNTANYNGIRTNEIIYNSDKHGYFWGPKATLAIWVKSSRALTVYAAAGDGKQDGSNYYKTDKTYTIPAGESILRIPLADFNVANPLGADTSCDNAFTWRSIQALRLYFQCASPRENNLSNGTIVYFDEFAIESPIIGDINDDAKVNVADLVGLKNYVAATEPTGDIQIYDVGSESFDDKGYSLADGAADSTDLTVMIKQLLGVSKVARAPYVATDTTEQTLVVSTLADWGTDTE